MVLFSEGAAGVQPPTPSREVFDVQGAWDTAAALSVVTGVANSCAVSEDLPRAFFAAGAGR